MKKLLFIVLLVIPFSACAAEMPYTVKWQPTTAGLEECNPAKPYTYTAEDLESMPLHTRIYYRKAGTSAWIKAADVGPGIVEFSGIVPAVEGSTVEFMLMHYRIKNDGTEIESCEPSNIGSKSLGFINPDSPPGNLQ